MTHNEYIEAIHIKPSYWKSNITFPTAMMITCPVQNKYK